MNVIYPVILSGGSGTRLWPLSRAMYPKQFISVFNDRGSSLLATTLQRLASTDGFAQPTIVCNNDHRFLVKEDAERAGVTPRKVVLEPLARNTAPAAAVAALLIERADPAGILVVMPSDHVIKDEAGFVAAIRQAAEVAATGKLVLLGVKPGGPHIGYGYIRRGPPLPGFPAAHVVEAFTEKPDKAAAAGYVSAGTYFWNSGIFIFRARVYLDELARLQPSILEAATQALADATERLVRENEFGLHHGHPMAPPREPRQDAARADRGADRQLPRRGRHYSQRGRLQSQPERDEVRPARRLDRAPQAGVN